jgi:agmatinase
MGQNFLGLEDDQAALETARAVVVPVPYETTCSYGKGASRGPRAVIEASPNAEWFDEEVGCDLKLLGIATLPELAVGDIEPGAMAQVVEREADRILAAGKLPVGLGGEHTVSLGFIRAALEHHPGLTVLQIDAHPDLRDSFEGRSICHATVGRRILELAPLVQIGVRAWSREEHDLMVKASALPQPEAGAPGAAGSGAPGAGPGAARPAAAATSHPLAVIPAATAHSDPGWIDIVTAALGDVVYVSFDVDALDPSLMPATGTPEPGGLSWRQAADLLAAVAARSRIIGCDVVELAPIDGLFHCNYTAARLAARLIALSLHG